MSRMYIPRRRFLRCAATGVASGIALPPLNAMFNDNGTALAQGAALPQRFGLFFWGNGNRPERWRPLTTGPDWTPSEELTPLANVKEYVSVLSDMNIATERGSAHHTGRGAILAGAYDPNNGTYGSVDGPSVDQIAAEAWQGLTPYRSLELGISMRSKGGVNANRARGSTSWSDTATSVPAEFSPAALFDRLFGTAFDGSDEEKARELATRQSILDTILVDANELRAKVGTQDQARIDAHLDGIRDLENKLAANLNACQVPAEPTDPEADLGHELLDERNDLMSDILTMAVACDLTRVFSYEYMGMQADTIFWQVGATEGSHVMTHDDRNLPEVLEPQPEKIHQAVTFIMGHFAVLLEKLKAVPEGGGTVLDNCAIMAVSEVENGTAHRYDNMPILIAGRAGGALQSGIHYEGNGENTSKAHLTCLRAVGVDVPSFGKAGGMTTETIGALEA